MFDNSAYRKVLRLIGRSRDEYGSVPEDLRDLLERKDEYLIYGGANVFEELVKSSHGKINSFRIFSLKELQKATNNFSADQVLSNRTWDVSHTYRGTIEGKRVAVKIYHWLFLGKHFRNEVVSLSLIKHRNVVKLLGCCLETRSPIVVHELPPNGTLEENISKLSWTDRLRIATEIADAVAYLHSELNITHGSLDSTEAVLLDEFHSAKLGAFDFSQIQNQDESSDAETDNENKSEKRLDVYFFGRILLTLLGIYDVGKVERYDKVEILKYLKLNVSAKEMPQIEAYIDLSLICLHRDDEHKDKSHMEEVARELRRISMINSQPTTDGNDSHNLSSGAN